MLRHNLLLIYRNFKRFKGTFFINLIGLSTGLACTLLIYLWVKDELAVDQFHKKGDRLYHIMENRVQAQGIWTSPTTSGPMAESLVAEFPEVEYAVQARGIRQGDAVLSIDENNVRAGGYYVGKDFFNMFSYDLISGDANQVLKDKNAIVVSESTAKKLFNTADDVVGKTVDFQHEKQYIITGVFRDVPQSSSEQFDFLLSYEELKEMEWAKSWGNTGLRTYVLLKPGTDVTGFNNKIKDYVRNKTNNEVNHRTPFAALYPEIYLHDHYENGAQAGGRIDYVNMFSIVAVFILAIACINFMNLSTARASRRLKEVGIKKAVGAGRRVLALQHLGESVLMAFISSLVAIILIEVVLPQFNEITGKHLTLNFDMTLLLVVLGVTLFTGLIAGSYPALYLSGFSPATVLKGKLSNLSKGFAGELWARKGLVVFQFTLSVMLMVAVLVVYKQIDFLQNKKLGYERDNVIYFAREGKLAGNDNLETFLTEMKNIPGVVNVSGIAHDMTGHNSGTYGVQWEGRDPEDKTEFENAAVYYGMIETLGIEVKEGRTFSRDFADSASIIFNESAIKYMGMQDPIGKVVKLWGEDRTIVGVVKDFNFQSLHEQIKPLFFRLQPESTYLIMARIEAGKEKETIERLQKFYQAFNPGFSFDYTFLDQDYKEQYAAENRVAVLSEYFAGLAVLISCLGLFGLATFTAERRLKEIGIRKILGSSIFSIIYLLSSDFTRMVFMAILIALPISYFAASHWLEGFAFKIGLEPWFFISAAVLALVITWLTVGLQALKAASVNPTKCLKDE